MDNISIRYDVLGAVATNCYYLINDTTKETIIIDPAGQADRIEARIAKEGLTPVAILLTHGHFDHILAVPEVRHLYSIPVYAYEAEAEVLASTALNMSPMIGTSVTMEADTLVRDDEMLHLAGIDIRVIFTPGHTQGGCCFYLPDYKVLFSGDTLFNTSIGRTDFPSGSMSALVRSVKEKLFPLPEDTAVYPGHEDRTTIGYEKQYNPFCC